MSLLSEPNGKTLDKRFDFGLTRKVSVQTGPVRIRRNVSLSFSVLEDKERHIECSE